MARVYLVDDSGTLDVVDRAIIDGVPYTQACYPMTRTNKTRALIGWPDSHAREWVTDAGNVYLVPEPADA